jgi:hypothetical protein
MWLVLVPLAIGYVIWYGNRVRAKPARSLVAIGSPFQRSWPPVGRVDTAALTLRGRAVRLHPVIAWS